MVAGIAVRGNLLAVAWSAARGHVFLFDLLARQRVSAWTTPLGASGWSDAAGIALDANYRLFVADPHNDCVRIFNVFGQHLGDLGAAAPATGDAARDRVGVLHRPHAVAVGADTVFVTAGDLPRRRGVQRFHLDGRVRRPLAARGDPALPFAAPRGLWVDRSGILVADTLRGAIQWFRADGTYVRETLLGENGCVARPIAVARLPDQRLCVVDAGDRPGLIVLAGDGRPTAAAAHLAAACSDLVGLAIDGGGRLLLLDQHGERVVRATSDLDFDEVVVDLEEHVADPPPRPT